MARRQKTLGARWQLDAAMLTMPVDLTTLVSMSLTDPEEFFRDDCLHRMVKILLNESNSKRSDHNTKLDVLTILANLAKDKANTQARDEIKVVLGGVSEWFDEYLTSEPIGGLDEHGIPVEPEMHKSMLLVMLGRGGWPAVRHAEAPWTDRDYNPPSSVSSAEANPPAP